MTYATRSLALALGLSLAGCGWVDTDYRRPVLDLPTRYAATATTAAPVSDDWWTAFGDPDLDRLVARALDRNNDLTVSVEAVRQARLRAGLAQGDLYPDAAASAEITRDRTLSAPRATTRESQVSASLTWDPDPWGALAKTRDAAELEAQASYADLDEAARALAATTTELYWQLVYYRERIALSEQSIAYAQRTYDLTRARYDAGAVSSLDVLEAEQSLRTQEAADTEFRQSLTETENALAILFDGPPQPADVARETLPQGDPPPVDAGLPVQVLERRADLRAAEARLKASLATVDATQASFLPAFTLTGSLGSSSIALTDALKNPFAGLGAGLSLPFLNWHEMKRNVAISDSEYRAGIADFRQTLYTALADVENALSSRRQLALRHDRLQRALDTAREVERLYEVRYRSGAVDLQSWLDAQEKRRTAEQSLLGNTLDRLNAQVNLYRALGGGATLPEARAAHAADTL
jgi:NodT family efflux transporter outer membrane factor (OMF) lipoprotein